MARLFFLLNIDEVSGMEGIREWVQGWGGKLILGLIVGLLGLSLLLADIQSSFTGNSREPGVAEVNGVDVSRDLFDRVVRNQKERLLANMGPEADPSKIDEKALREEVRQALVDRELLSQAADAASYHVSEAQLHEFIRSNPSFQEEGKFSQQRFEQALQQQGMNPTAYMAMLRSEHKMQQMLGGFAQGGFVTRKEFERLMALDAQKRDVHLAVIPVAPNLAKVTVSDAEVKADYEANVAKYLAPEQVSIEYLELRRQDLAATMTVTEQDIQARYQERVKALSGNEQRRAAHILIKVDDKTKDAAALAKIKDIEKRVRAGEDFAKLAKEFSQDEGSVASGGDLGFTGRGQFVPEFDKAMFAMKAGEVTPPVKTEYGYHLIKLLEVRTEAAPSLASLRAELEQEAREAKVEDLYQEQIEKLNEVTYEAADLKGPSAQFKLPIRSLPAFTRKGGVDLAANRKVIDAAFSDEAVKEGKTLSVDIDNGRVIWLRVAQHQPERRRPLTEVAAQVRQHLQLEKARKLAEAEAQAVVKAVNAGKSLAEVAASHKLQWADRAATDRRTQFPHPLLKEVAFRVAKPAVGKVSAEVADLGTDFAVVAVSKVESGSASIPAEQQANVRAMLGEARSQFDLQDYLAYQRSKAEIVLPKDKAAEKE